VGIGAVGEGMTLTDGVRVVSICIVWTDLVFVDKSGCAMIDTNVKMSAPVMMHMPAAVKPISMRLWRLFWVWAAAETYIACGRG
jgi:hypothetical protein